MSHMGHADRNLEAGVDKRGKHSRAPCGARGLKFLLFLCWYVFDLVAPRMGRIV